MEQDNIWDGKSIWDEDSSDWVSGLLEQAEEEAQQMQMQEEEDENDSLAIQLAMEDDVEEEYDMERLNELYNPSSSSGGKGYEYTKNYFMNKHNYDLVHARAAAGNFQHESGNQPLNHDDGANGPGGGGVAQWSPVRYKNLIKFANERGLDYRSLDTQLDFVDYELRTTEKKAGDAFFREREQARATETLMKKYLRPSYDPKVNHLNDRIETSMKQYGGYQDNKDYQYNKFGLRKAQYSNFSVPTYNGMTPSDLDVDNFDVLPNEGMGEEGMFDFGIATKAYDLLKKGEEFLKQKGVNIINGVEDGLNSTISRLSGIQDQQNYLDAQAKLKEERFTNLRPSFNLKKAYV